MNKYVKFLYSDYYCFDMFILDYFKYYQKQKLLENKKLKGKRFDLPKSGIPLVVPIQHAYFHYLQIFTSTLSNHPIYIKKIYTKYVTLTPYDSNSQSSVANEYSFYFPETILNKRSSTDFFFRTLLCFDSQDDATNELNFLVDYFNKTHKIIVKGSFEKYKPLVI